MNEVDYSYKGFRPYGAGELYVIDAYTDYGFSGNAVESVINEGLATFEVLDDKNAVLRFKTIDVDFVKED